MDTEGIDLKVSCKVFKTISWSKKDTRLTQEQIVVHNKVWKDVCR